MAADPQRARKKKGRQGGGGGGSSQRKPAKHKNKKRLELYEYAQATLGAGNIREAVKKPDGEDINEWFAVNVVDFFNEISLLYGIVTEYCTKEQCPVMSAGPKYEYLWADGKKVPKPIKCSAPEYINALFTWVDEQINDPRIFPVEYGAPFPDNFKKGVIQPILKRLFRVYGHLYHHHIQKIVQLDAEAHLNTCFKHFLYFVKEFRLVSDREFAPLKNTIDGMLLMDDQRKYKPKYAKAGSGAATATVGTVANGGVGGGGGVATGPSSGTSAAAPAQ